MTGQSFDEIASVVNTWRATLPTRQPSASLPVDVWAEAYVNAVHAIQDARFTREFTKWLDAQP